jgi:galactokinase
MNQEAKILESFEKVFGTKARVGIRAPGRVNLIGEHTDYSLGFVMPMAIDRGIWIAARPRTDSLISCWSLNFDELLEFDLQNFKKADPGWGEYVKGVSWALQESGQELRGWDAVVFGDIPIGAGLSSSAAMEIAVARTHSILSGFDWQPIEMAKIARRAENEWVGVSCGIMDQLISAAGQPDHGLLIDCRSLEMDAIPLPPQSQVVVLDTTTRRDLVTSEYDQRAQDCENAAAFFGQKFLRDVSLDDLMNSADEINPRLLRRARHVITENQRVMQAADAMRVGNAARFGQLMVASHASLRDDFEVSSPELNQVVDLARDDPACYGARMTGAGFGGCAVAVVSAEQTDQFVARIKTQYERAYRVDLKAYPCQPSDGVEVFEILD